MKALVFHNCVAAGACDDRRQVNAGAYVSSIAPTRCNRFRAEAPDEDWFCWIAAAAASADRTPSRSF